MPRVAPQDNPCVEYSIGIPKLKLPTQSKAGAPAVIRGTLISISLLLCYALTHAAMNRNSTTTERAHLWTRVDATLAKICYPLCLLVHSGFVFLLIASVVSSWGDDFPLGIAMAVLIYGGLALVLIWSSLAFVSNWFSGDRIHKVTRLTLVVSLIELLVGLALFLAVTLGVLP